MELDACLKATGLDDCELTAEDEQALAEEPIFAEFKVGDVFGKALHTKYHNPKDLVLDAEGYPYICASNANNGINKDLPMVNGDDLILTPKKIIAWGKQCPMFCVHSEACVTSQGMYFLDMTAYSDLVCLYICSALDKACSGKFGYSNCLIGKVMDEQVISLPVIPSADPAHVYTPADIDWGYMERYIAELEEERVAELEEERVAELDAYLKATGLDDCELTAEDEQALAEEPAFAEFRVGDVMQVDQTKSVVAKKDLVDGDIPYVTRTISDNGYTSTCGNADRINLGNCITIGAETGIAFYQPNSFVAGNKVYRLSRDGVEAKQYLYLAGVLNKQTSNYSYSNARIPEKIKAEQISLPVIPSADPAHVYTPADIDWGYMKRYIRATEKLVMADVVAYKDRVIAETKRIVYASASPSAPAESEAVA